MPTHKRSDRTLTNDFPAPQLPAPSTDGPQPVRPPGRQPIAYLPAQSPADQRRARRSATLSAATEAIHLALPHQQPLTPPIAGTVFTPNAGADERTTAMDRAKATVYRTHPMTVILALLATGLALHFQLGMGLTLCIFAATAVTGYWLFHHSDYRYSRAGLERHRIDQATHLSHAQMQHERALRELALTGIIRQLEVRPDDYE